MTFRPIAVVATAYRGLEGWKHVKWRDDEGEEVGEGSGQGRSVLGFTFLVRHRFR